MNKPSPNDLRFVFARKAMEAWYWCECLTWDGPVDWARIDARRWPRTCWLIRRFTEGVWHVSRFAEWLCPQSWYDASDFAPAPSDTGATKP